MKNCLILGAKSDIGEAIAYKFAQEGYSITLCSRKVHEYLTELSKDIGVKYNMVPQLAEFDAQEFATHGEFYRALACKPDVVISVFGYLGDQQRAETSFDEAAKIINTNFTGNISILQIIAQDLEKRNCGTIIGISSVAGDRGRQSNFIYGASKGAFSIFLAGLRNRLYRSGVHVMTVKLGFAATQMTAHLSLPPFITASPAQVADGIYNAYRKKRDVVYILPIWRAIMRIICLIPESIFKRMKL